MNVNDTNILVMQARVQSANILTAVSNLRRIKDRSDRLGAINDVDIQGENEGITVAQLGAAMGATLTALETALEGTHGTNLETIAYFPGESGLPE